MKKLYFILIIIASFNVNYGQTYTIDNTFNPTDNGIYNQFIGLYGTILNNGKILTSEGIGTRSPFFLDGPSALERCIYRLNNDGSVDNSFTKVNLDYLVKSFFANPNQGNFITVNNNVSGNSTELKSYNNNGIMDATFNVPILSRNGGAGSISKIQFLNDGKILILGGFNQVNGLPYNNIVRLNSNGSVDTTFVIGSGFAGGTTAFALQPDGKYIIGGSFSYYNGVSKGMIARLFPDGTLDTSFNVNTVYNSFGLSTGLDINGPLNDIIVLPDGKIVTSGTSLYSSGSVYRRYIVRFNSNGTVDPSFNLFFSNPSGIYPERLLLSPDGSIYFKVSGSIKKINTSGIIDSTFNDGNIFLTEEGKMFLQNNKLLVVGNYKNVSGVTRIGYHRLNAIDGSLDVTFNPSYGPNNIFYSNITGSLETGGVASKIYGLMLPDNKILLNGGFTTYNDIPVKKMIRLFENGELDTTFNFDFSPIDYNSINLNDQFNIQTRKNYDGNIYISGNFQIPNQAVRRIIKFNSDGGLDLGFNFYDNVLRFKVNDENKIIASVIFNSGSGNQYKVNRYNSDGSLDVSFTSPIFNYQPMNIELLDDNKTLLSFNNSINGKYLVTLDATGTTLPMNNLTLNIPIFKTKNINGKIYSSSNSLPYLLFRYNNDWTFDSSFNQIETSNSSKYIILSNERTVTSTTDVGQYTNTLLYKINDSNGIQTSSVSIPNNIYETTSIMSQNCENIILVGSFFKIYETNRNNIIRLSVPGLTLTPTPTGELNQLFTQGQTLADLIINGQNLQWYSTQSECAFNSMERNSNEMNSILPNNTLLVNGMTYYVTQTINGVESNHRLPVNTIAALSTQNFEFGSEFILYPNPAKDVLNIQSKNSLEIQSIEIYNLLGQVVLAVPNSSNAIDVSNLKTGTYFVKVNTSNGTSNNKFVKE
ncbi:T9SS type A sorting domain-containing protein [Flavobacterium sp. N2270]|uniref:T9SS type A sorting domain-containing protein n=1 Tax=Flavobacterium sp. N2270 TaxID=2986831 RepID=UPI002224861F|nr:T9SS type A sorting domain-containing protein [Flavobacterium sp. N2270]